MCEAADGKAAQKAVWERWEAGEIEFSPLTPALSPKFTFSRCFADGGEREISKSGAEVAGGEDFAAGFATLRVEGVAIREGAAGVRCDTPVHGLLASGGIG